MLGPIGSFIGGVVAASVVVGGLIKRAFITPLEEDVDELGEEVEKAMSKAEEKPEEVRDELKERIDEVEDQVVETHGIARSNEYMIQGDEDDPNYSGLAQDVKEIKDEVVEDE
jgi:hypothetical protein